MLTLLNYHLAQQRVSKIYKKKVTFFPLTAYAALKGKAIAALFSISLF